MRVLSSGMLHVPAELARGEGHGLGGVTADGLPAAGVCREGAGVATAGLKEELPRAGDAGRGVVVDQFVGRRGHRGVLGEIVRERGAGVGVVVRLRGAEGRHHRGCTTGSMRGVRHQGSRGEG